MNIPGLVCGVVVRDSFPCGGVWLMTLTAPTSYPMHY